METSTGRDKDRKRLIIAIIIAICISSLLSIILYIRLQNKIDFQLSDARLRILMVELALKEIPIQTSCKLDFSYSGYAPVDTNSGVFLIAVKNISPHGTGSRVSFEIGNITSGTATKFKMKVITEGKNTDQSKITEKDFSDNLEPGSWTLVTCSSSDLI